MIQQIKNSDTKRCSIEDSSHLVQQLQNLSKQKKQQYHKQSPIQIQDYSLDNYRSSSTQEWSQKDSELLVQLYKKYGRRWKQISTFYEQKSPNMIKNRFYSKLRKNLRFLNNCINKYYKCDFKTFNLNIIFKITNLINLKIPKMQNLSQEVIQYYSQFIYRFLDYQQFSFQQQMQSEKQSTKLQTLSLILSFNALQNLWKLIQNHNRTKQKLKNSIKNIKFKLNNQTDDYLVITLDKYCICTKDEADLILKEQMQKQSLNETYGLDISGDNKICYTNNSSVRQQIQIQSVNQEDYADCQGDIFDQNVKFSQSQNILF